MYVKIQVSSVHIKDPDEDYQIMKIFQLEIMNIFKTSSLNDQLWSHMTDFFGGFLWTLLTVSVCQFYSFILGDQRVMMKNKFIFYSFYFILVEK